MKNILTQIIREKLGPAPFTLYEIKGLGSVNRVFSVKIKNEEYIIRINEEKDKLIEYKKESWCIGEVKKLGIPVPKVYEVGVCENFPFMIQDKVSGINGKQTDANKKMQIWERLGNYAAIYQQIEQIEDKEVQKSLFHKDWNSRLQYNLEELNDNDSLLANHTFSKKEQQKAKSILLKLQSKDFKSGLVHGDLCPRNVMVKDESIHLLDWGTAEINVVPHIEIGLLLMSKEVSPLEIQLFLKGLGMTMPHFLKIEAEIKMLNFLHRLDLYRWAEGQVNINLKEFMTQVQLTYKEILLSGIA